jgi:hypothetical protein
MSKTEAVSAKLTMLLEASTGYSADCSATISPEQWGDLNAVVHGKRTTREKHLVTVLEDARELLANVGVTSADTADYGNGRADEIIGRIDEALMLARA